MHGNVALQVGDADYVRIEHAVGTEQRDLGVVGTILAEYVDRQQHYVRVKLFHAPPNQTKAAEGLVAGKRVARCGLHVFHVAAKNGGKKPGQELRERTDQILLMT